MRKKSGNPSSVGVPDSASLPCCARPFLPLCIIGIWTQLRDMIREV